MTSYHWPAPAKEYALDLIGAGHSGTVVARMVNAAFPGLYKSRNAVIGLAYRNGVHLKGGNPGTGGVRPKARKPRPRNTKPFVFSAKALSPAHAIIKDGLPIPDPKETDIAKVSMLSGGGAEELQEHQCKWPVGDPLACGAYAPLFCGEPRVKCEDTGRPILPYCEPHASRAYQIPQPRRPAPAAPVPAEPAKVLEAA